MHLKKTLVGLAVALWTCGSASADAPIVKMPHGVPNEWIVTVKPRAHGTVAKLADEIHQRHGGELTQVYEEDGQGFCLRLPESALTGIAKNPNVERIEQNSTVFLSTMQDTTVLPDGGAEPGAGTLWGLDRIDYAGGDNRFSYCDTGSGVKIYIIDTGVLDTHQEFFRSDTDHGSRVEAGVTIRKNPGTNESASNPCAVKAAPRYSGLLNGGHGTAVASIAAGRVTGVAKSATVVPVKVLDCSGYGTVADLNAGIDWIQSERNADPSVRRVVNMSLFYYVGTPPLETCAIPPFPVTPVADLTLFESKIRALMSPLNNPIAYDAGVTVVVSANNQNGDASLQTPARMGKGGGLPAPNVITVGGITTGDRRWVNANATLSCNNLEVGSNWGRSVDIYAPATTILSAAITQSLNTNTWGYRLAATTGTSFAAPFVTGVAARIAQTAYVPRPDEVWNEMKATALVGVLTLNDPSTAGSSANLLVRRSGADYCGRIRP